MISILILILLGIICWFWADSMQARKIAIITTQRACEIRQLQLLDETVALKKISLKRGKNTRFAIWRTYQFDYCTNNDTRLHSTITLCGKSVVKLDLETRNNIVKLTPRL